MPSVWIEPRKTKHGKPRYIVKFNLGGRATRVRYGGSFKTEREALLRSDWIAGELAAFRVPHRDLIVTEASTNTPTFAEAAKRWQESRVDVAEATTIQHATSLNRALPTLGALRVDEITAQDVANVVAALHERGIARGSIRKTIQACAMVLDYVGVAPNVARDRVTVRLPREEVEEVNPPTAEHVEMVFHLLPSKHRLALLWLDWSGARVSSIDLTLVSDYDEPRRRVRLRASTTKTRKALWIDLPDVLADALEASLGPREDRDPDARLFTDSNANALRTAIGKACKGRGHSVVQPARPPPPANLASPPAGPLLGGDRPVRRSAITLRDGRHVHARPDR